MNPPRFRSPNGSGSRGTFSPGTTFLRRVAGSRALLALLLSASAVAAAACEGADYAGEGAELDGDPVGRVTQPIYQGSVVSSAANTGVVRVNDLPTGSFCSGTLLKNDWVLTAAHCVDIDLDWNFAPRGARTGSANGDAVNAVAGVSDSTHYYAGSAYSGGSRILLFGKMSGTPGVHDTTFGAGGRATRNVASASTEEILALTTQSDGKIVGVGSATVNGKKQFLVARVTTSGAFDTTFDGDGVVLTNFLTMDNEYATAVMIDSSNRIVVGGRASNANGTQFALARYNPDGSLDTTFEDDGKVLTAWPGVSVNVWINKIAKTSDNKIVAVGGGSNPGTAFAPVARYNSNGTLDTTFDGDGRVTLSASPATAEGLVVDSDKRIVIGGSHNGVAKVWRLTTTGALDTTFNANTGYATPTFFDATATGVVDLTYAGGNNLIRLITKLQLTNGKAGVGVSEFYSADGVLRPHQVFPTLTGKVHELANNAVPKAAAASFRADQNRVILAGTDGTGATSRVSFIAVWPERKLFTPAAGVPYGVQVEMDGNVRNITVVRQPMEAMDVAIAKLDNGLPMGVPPSNTGYVFPGFSSKNSANVPFNVECWGYGATYLDGNGNPAGAGSLHKGTSRVLSYDTHYANLGFATTVIADQQLPFPGDSGSSCRDKADGNKIVSVHSRQTNTWAGQVPAYKFSTWVLSHIY